MHIAAISVPQSSMSESTGTTASVEIGIPLRNEASTYVAELTEQLSATTPRIETEHSAWLKF